MADIGPFPGRGCFVPHPDIPGMLLYLGTEVMDSGLGPQRTLVIGHMINGVFNITMRWNANDDGGYVDATNHAGGMGKLVFGNHIPGDQYEKGEIPQFEAFLNMIYGGYSPTAPAVTNAEPFDGKRFDALFYQYMTVTKDPVTGRLTPTFKPHP